MYFDLLDFHQLLDYSWPLLTEVTDIYYLSFITEHVDVPKKIQGVKSKVITLKQKGLF